MMTAIMTEPNPLLDLVIKGLETNDYIRLELSKLGHFFPTKDATPTHYQFLLSCSEEGLDLPDNPSWSTRRCEDFCREHSVERSIRGQYMLLTKGYFV